MFMEPMATGPVILGFHLNLLLMFASGIFYLICAYFLWKPYRREKNELLGALFAFLVYQAIAMFFMGLEVITMNPSYEFVAALAIFIGSAYMLKFPFSSFSRMTRKIVFALSIIITLGIFVWFMQTPERQMVLGTFSIWYDIIINGLIAGGSILIFGFGARERWMRVRALGGGTGVVSCCVVSNAAMLSGAFLASSVFQFFAPVIILTVLSASKKKTL